jgi:putative tryptophan/tyrosine transport system substrate-binding protein
LVTALRYAASLPNGSDLTELDQLKRRSFITLLGGAATWPLAARAQQPERMRRIGMLMHRVADDPEGQARFKAFVQGLQQLGWVEGRNVRLDVRWTAGVALQRYAAELVALMPDVILADGAVMVSALQGATRSVPIIFVAAPDPVGAGFVKSMARPGGNTTGFMSFEYAVAPKWLELLKEIAPSLTRAAVLRDPTVAAGIGQFAAIQAAAPTAMELSVIDVRDVDAIAQDVAEFARDLSGGLIVTVGPFGANHPNVITTLADRYKLPAVYPFRYFVGVGGLMSYGPDLVSLFHPAAGYVDRILKGEKPADLPVQAPTKYELVINLKAAKALGIEVPATLLARADEVIE